MADVAFDFTDRVVLVTGASRGIGRGIALGFAAAGASVAVTSRHPERLAAVCREIEAAGGQALGLRFDAGDLATIGPLVEAILARFGRVDVLVNNAGTSIRQPAADVTEPVWDHLVATNLKGVFFCTQAIGRLMVRQRRGAIVTIGSVAQAFPRPELAVYAGTKAAVAQLTRALALEWAAHNVRVNCVAPGYVRTPLVEPLFRGRPGFLDEILSRTPLRRVAEPEEIAASVMFLASDKASFITGQTLFVDGGWTIE